LHAANGNCVSKYDVDGKDLWSERLFLFRFVRTMERRLSGIYDQRIVEGRWDLNGDDNGVIF